MKLVMLAVLCLGSVVSAAEETQRFAATLPNGVTVELVGVSFHSLEKRLHPAQWWRPDGSSLPEEVFRRPDKYTAANYDEYSCEFALRISGADGYSCVAFNSLGQSNVVPEIPRDANDQPMPTLRAFVCNFKKTCSQDTIRIGVSTAPWEQVDRWKHAWHKYEPDDITVDSDGALVFTWPRKHARGAIIVEITHRYVDEATRLLIHDHKGNVHLSEGSRHGRGQGLEKRTYWHWDTQLEDIDAFEFQKRPYQWVEFRNVSLQPNLKTVAEVSVLGEQAALSEERSRTHLDTENLGSMLDRLAVNLAFPATGRAHYQIRESSTFLPDPRLLTCSYAFSGALYAFEVAEVGSEGLDFKSYFNGNRSVRWMMQNDVATVWEGRREQRPIYRLDRFWPADIVDDLLGHDVEFLGASDLEGVRCSLLTSTLSSKDKLKVWVSHEPAVFPLRIERYEHDRLRYLYEARSVRTRNGSPYPEQIREVSYRWDEATGLVPTGSFDVIVESFEPNAHMAPQVFTPQFSPETTVSTHRPVEPEASVFAPTTPARRIQSLRDIAVQFDLEQAQGEMLLLCFFDMNQRPARRCVVQLAERAEELEKKGIRVVAVQVSRIDRAELDAWTARQKTPFPVGSVKDNIEKATSAWGVRSLPWLVLTDAAHVVRAEGFTVAELPGRLESIAEEQ